MKRSRRRVTGALPRCVLDSGGVTALLGRSQSARAWLRWLANHGGEIVVPAAVLSECITGDVGRDAEVNRILGALSIMPTGEPTGRLAGALRFRAKTDDGIDAIVAAEAAVAQVTTVLLTSDPKDLARLLSSAKHVKIQRA